MQLRFGKFAGRAALALALAATLALAACGRKGGLDAPPMATAGDVQSPGAQPSSQAAAPQAQGASPSAATATQPPDKRKTFLDWLIN
jgi:predicted small lipoprotein YifL